MSTKTFPVVEIFGPVAEGEGPLAGAPTHYVRFGLCDYRCVWCDSMHAVLPERVKEIARPMTAQQIYHEVMMSPITYPLVTLSGGNPAIHDLGELVGVFQALDMKVKVETQGSIWKPWLADVDYLIWSPKPPSSGWDRPGDTRKFATHCIGSNLRPAPKLVIFNPEDLDWAYLWMKSIEGRVQPLDNTVWLSCGTDPRDTRDTLGERYAWLINAALQKFAYAPFNIRILPQLHVVAYLHKLGV